MKKKGRGDKKQKRTNGMEGSEKREIPLFSAAIAVYYNQECAVVILTTGECNYRAISEVSGRRIGAIESLGNSVINQAYLPSSLYVYRYFTRVR